jgi:Mg-chelatase subunit ChlD
MTAPETTPPTPSEANAPVALSILLDRSGSMMAIADDIVRGLNALLASQRVLPGQVIVTLAQFDSQDPFELLVDAVPLREVTDMARTSFQPRGSTPLFDAIGRLLSHVDRTGLGTDEGVDHVVAIITDGMENASHEYTRSAIFDLIQAKRDAGWVFIFLGSEPESYADAASIAVAPANRRSWARSSEGTAAMMDTMSGSLSSHRGKTRSQRQRDRDDFYGDGGEK